MVCAGQSGVAGIKKLEDLTAWQRAMQFWDAVNPILERPGLQRDARLRTQLSDALDSILSNISEGFEQPTDRAFAKYLYDAKASTAEVRTRLLIARERKFITPQEYQERDNLGDEVARIVNGLIKYLRRSDRRERGLGSDDKD
jgi:four helix bundle protein